MKNFLSALNEYRVSRKLTFISEVTPSLEIYDIGKAYYLCGYSGNAKIFSKKNSQSNIGEIPACNVDQQLQRVIITSLDDEWIGIDYIPAVSGQYSGEYEVNPDQNSIEGESVKKDFVLRKTVTTPFVITDGKIQLALPERSIGKVTVQANTIVVEGDSVTCDDEEVSPFIVIGKKNEMIMTDILRMEHHYSVKTYPLPTNFNSEQIQIKKNFTAVFELGDMFCGT